MSFIKSLVKEVNVAMSMIDIPALKHERDKLQSELDKCLTEIEKVNDFISFFKNRKYKNLQINKG